MHQSIYIRLDNQLYCVLQSIVNEVSLYHTLAPTSNPRAVTTLTLSQGRSRGHTCLTITRIIFQPLSFGDTSWITVLPLSNRLCCKANIAPPRLLGTASCIIIQHNTFH